MKIRHIILTIFSFLMAVPSIAEEQPFLDISEELKRILKGSKVPSLAAAAVHKGEIVSAGAYGIRKVGSDDKVTVDDKYHIGSCGKSMTATLAAILVEQGKLEWDLTVAEAFPEVDIHKSYKSVTLQMLLTNVGGVPGDIESDLWSRLWQLKGTSREQRAFLVQEVLKQPAEYKPGRKNVYSNAGFSIAGAMLEAKLDDSYEHLLRKFLFEPLKLNTAGFGAPATNNLVDQPYGHIQEGSKVKAVDPEPGGDNPEAITPAGRIHCSVLDFAEYAKCHLGYLDKKLLSTKSLQTLHEPYKKTDYAMGWGVLKRSWADGIALTHTGSNTMFYAVIWLAPKKDFAAVAVCNYGDEEGFEKCDEAIGFLIKKYLR